MPTSWFIDPEKSISCSQRLAVKVKHQDPSQTIGAVIFQQRPARAPAIRPLQGFAILDRPKLTYIVLFLCRCQVQVPAGDVVLAAFFPVRGDVVDEKTKSQKPHRCFDHKLQCHDESLLPVLIPTAAAQTAKETSSPATFTRPDSPVLDRI